MPDIQHTYGSDLTLSATGGIALSDGTQLGQERVLRRLLTAINAYCWHTSYGAGLPAFVGEVADKSRIEAVARSQMYLEQAVARTPAPTVSADVQDNGVVTLNIQYVDAETNEAVTLSFGVNG